MADKDPLPPKPVPEVRQNQDQAADQFGRVAINGGTNRWLIGDPTNGGYWGTDEDVDGWTLLTASPE